MSRLKTENDALEKKYEFELKLHEKTKNELENFKNELETLLHKYKQAEKEMEILNEKNNRLKNSERKLSESLDSMGNQCEILQKENAEIREKIILYTRDRDESLKEQKDLLNKYAIVGKELQKLQDKYKNVKAECNDRTNVIHYLEIMLKENIMEYNNKITYLENNITHILSKISACQFTIKDNNVESNNEEVENLKQQLNETHEQRKKLENMVGNYYSIMKNLQNEIQNREKEVDELNLRLSVEHEKCLKINNENEKLHKTNVIKSKTDVSKFEQMQCEISTYKTQLIESKKQIEYINMNHENEKKKLELVIVLKCK